LSNLPESEFFYISSRTPLINIDMLVVNEYGEILLSWRDDEYCGTGWHIPGGIIRHGETMRERLERTAKAELGFVPEFEENPCKITEIFLQQEYRNHFISHLFKGSCKREDVITVEKPIKPGDLKWLGQYEGLVYSQAPYEEYLKTLFKEKNNTFEEK
jgi:colanic acid biosynthesis protein WcaH